MSLDKRLRAVFASVFGIDGSTLTDRDSVKTIPEWDSINHIQLVMAVEAEFGMQFDAGEIADMTTVAALKSRLSRAGAHA